MHIAENFSSTTPSASQVRTLKRDQYNLTHRKFILTPCIHVINLVEYTLTEIKKKIIIIIILIYFVFYIIIILKQ